jgi:O-acetyl-ADP-ribose deacetylase (regulator of RNase III)
MTRAAQISYLIRILLQEMPQYQDFAQQFQPDMLNQRRLLRSLMNMREPMPLSAEFVSVQDVLLTAEKDEKGIVDVDTISSQGNSQLILWKGDITRLNAGAVVNAANSALLGCFYPCHGCIDNAVHSAAGLQLRDECSRIMQQQGTEEPVGQAKITAGYNLPCRYVIHTVGPVVHGYLTQSDRADLRSCYTSCMEIAFRRNLRSIAFCCISTGEFHFPNYEAAEIAVSTVNDMLKRTDTKIKVLFDVFKDTDYKIYQGLLRQY